MYVLYSSFFPLLILFLLLLAAAISQRIVCGLDFSRAYCPIDDRKVFYFVILKSYFQSDSMVMFWGPSIDYVKSIDD